MKLNEQIYRLRSEKKLSQNELAEALGVSRQSVSKWELGSSIPDLDRLVSMSELFGVSLDELVNGEKQPEPQKPAGEAGAPEICHVIREPRPLRQVVGIILLCSAGVLLLTCTLAFGDLLSGLILALPCVLCGVLCLALRRPAFWCVWALGLLAWIVMPGMTGIQGSGTVIAWLKGYIPFGPSVVIGFAVMLYGLGLIAATVHRFYKAPMKHPGRWCLGCAAARLLIFAAAQVLVQKMVDTPYSELSLWGWMAVSLAEFLLDMMVLLFAAAWLYQRKRE